MTYRPRRNCRECGRDRDQCGGVSRSGLCPDCGLAILTGNIAGLMSQSGPYFDAWRNGVTNWAASLWGTPESPAALTDNSLEEQWRKTPNRLAG